MRVWHRQRSGTTYLLPTRIPRQSGCAWPAALPSLDPYFVRTRTELSLSPSRHPKRQLFRCYCTLKTTPTRFLFIACRSTRDKASRPSLIEVFFKGIKASAILRKGHDSVRRNGNNDHQPRQRIGNRWSRGPIARGRGGTGSSSRSASSGGVDSKLQRRGCGGPAG